MKKFVKGKIYDTDTAVKVGYWDNGCAGSDPRNCAETLYRKKTGEYFLHGSGGPRTKYAKSCGDNYWSRDEDIIPLSYDAAQRWAAENLSGEDYEAIFGPVAEDEFRAKITVAISAAAAEKLRRKSSETGCTIGDIIETLVATL